MSVLRQRKGGHREQQGLALAVSASANSAVQIRNKFCFELEAFWRSLAITVGPDRKLLHHSCSFVFVSNIIVKIS